MEIRKYIEKNDYEHILLLFKSEDNWDWFLKDNVVFKHKKSLRESITYVAYEKDELIAYVRAIEDIEAFIYICELLVNKKLRGHGYGKEMLDRYNDDYPNHVIYVMSDEDGYYQKMDYKKVGSIFRVSKP